MSQSGGYMSHRSPPLGYTSMFLIGQEDQQQFLYAYGRATGPREIVAQQKG